MSEFGVGRGVAGCDVVRVFGEVLGRVRWLHVSYNIELILVVSHFRALIRNSNLKLFRLSFLWADRLQINHELVLGFIQSLSIYPVEGIALLIYTESWLGQNDIIGGIGILFYYFV